MDDSVKYSELVARLREFGLTEEPALLTSQLPMLKESLA